MSDKNRKVARGSTLFRPKDHKSVSKRREDRLKKLKNDNTKNISSMLRTIPDEKNIELVLKYLDSQGIKIKDYKRNYIVRRIRARITRNNFSTYKKYAEYLSTNKGEFEIIKKSLSINVTRFFRNRDTFDYIRKEIIPKLDQSKPIKLWSAGCAVGAEAYTVAMIMDGVKNYSLSATDIKQELIELGRGGLYDKGYLGEVNSKEQMDYFDNIDQKTVRVKHKFRSKVKFSILDLLKDKYPSGMDIIFCRNVLIYIEREPQIKIINGFLKALKPDGYLVLGRTESVFSNKGIPNITTFNSKHRIYQKKL